MDEDVTVVVTQDVQAVWTSKVDVVFVPATTAVAGFSGGLQGLVRSVETD